MVFSSAYAAVMGVLLPLITAETAVISDALNHNSIINAVLLKLGLETIPGAHPVVPLMVRDTQRTATLVKHLRDNHILATGLNYPMVPKGDEEIRFQICADHTPADIDHALAVLAAFEG